MIKRYATDFEIDLINKDNQSSTFLFSLPQNVVWDCDFVDFDHVSDEIVVIEEQLGL